MARRIDGETWLVVFFLVCLGVLMTVAFSVKYDAVRSQRKRAEIVRDQLQSEIRAKEDKIARLQADYNGLAVKKNPEIIEQVAREEGNMRPGEIAVPIENAPEEIPLPSSKGAVVIETNAPWRQQVAALLERYRTPAFIIIMGLTTGILLWQPRKAKKFRNAEE